MGVGIAGDVPSALETEITPPQDKGKGVATSSSVKKFRVTTTYKWKHAGYRSLRGRLPDQMTKKAGVENPQED